MRSSTRLATTLALSLALGGLASDVGASEPGFRILSTDGMTSEAQAHMDKGDELIAQRRYGKARKEYRAAADLVREQSDFPAAALYRVAASYYFEGLYRGAAKELDKIGAEAADYGDIVVNVWAVADAAWVLGQAGAKLDVEKRVKRLQRLLKSAYLPDEVRDEITSKRLGLATTLPNS